MQEFQRLESAGSFCYLPASQSTLTALAAAGDSGAVAVKSILCIPLLNTAGEAFGALQLLSRKESAFDATCELTIRRFVVFASLALQNAKLFGAKFKSITRGIKVARHMHEGLAPIHKQIERDVCELLGAQGATVFQFDERHQRLTTCGRASEVKVSVNAPKSLVVHTCSSMRTLRLDFAFMHPLFDPEVDQPPNVDLKSCLIVPMLSDDGKLLGALEIANKHDSACFTDVDEMLLLSAMPQYAELVSTASAAHEATRCMQVLQRLLETIEPIFMCQGRTQVFDFVFSISRQLCECTQTYVCVYDPFNDCAIVFSPMLPNNLRIKLNSSKSIITEVIHHCRLINIPSLAEQNIFEWELPVCAPAALLAAPLINAGDARPMGAIIVCNKGAASTDFSAFDEYILCAFSSQLAIALKKMEQTRRCRKVMMLTASFQQISMELELEPLLESVREAVCTTLNVDTATVYIVEASSHQFWTRSGTGEILRYSIGEGLVGTVAATGRPIHIADAQKSADFELLRDLTTGYRTHNLLCVPAMDSQSKIVGVIQATNKLPNRSDFEQEDEDFLKLLASQFAVMLANALDYERSVRARQQQSELVNVSRLVSVETDVSELVLYISHIGQSVLECRSLLLYLFDKTKDSLWTYNGDKDHLCVVNIILKPMKPICRCTLSHEQVIENYRLPKSTDDDAGVRASDNSEEEDQLAVSLRACASAGSHPGILCMPIKAGHTKDVLAVLEARDKQSGSGNFDKEDQQTLSMIGEILGTSICKMLEDDPTLLSVPENVKDLHVQPRRHRSWGEFAGEYEVRKGTRRSSVITGSLGTDGLSLMNLGVPGADVLGTGFSQTEESEDERE